MIFSTTILGEPVGEGRPRAVRMGPGVRVHAAPKSAQWRALAAQQMAAEWAGKAPITTPCHVRAVAYMPRPKTRPKDISLVEWKAGVTASRAQKPDIDNIAKALLDAIVQAGILADDAQVTDLHIMRRMCARADLEGHVRTPCVEVYISGD